MDVSLSSGIDLCTANNVHSTGPLGYLHKHHRLLSTVTLCDRQRITAIAIDLV